MSGSYRISYIVGLDNHAGFRYYIVYNRTGKINKSLRETFKSYRIGVTNLDTSKFYEITVEDLLDLLRSNKVYKQYSLDGWVTASCFSDSGYFLSQNMSIADSIPCDDSFIDKLSYDDSWRACSLLVEHGMQFPPFYSLCEDVINLSSGILTSGATERCETVMFSDPVSTVESMYKTSNIFDNMLICQNNRFFLDDNKVGIIRDYYSESYDKTRKVQLFSYNNKALLELI